MFDVNLRVPLIVRWPRVVRPGTVLDAMVSNIDTFPTVLGMLNVPAPKDYKHEGADFSPILRGEKTPWRQAVFGQYDIHNFTLGFMRSIRTEKYHLVRYHLAENMDELYDLQTDPDELKNRIKDAALEDVRRELEDRLTEWMRSIDDPVLALERLRK
jgi:uncharacterized sulfatase